MWGAIKRGIVKKGGVEVEMAEGVGRAALCPQKFYKRGFGECLDTDLVFECNVIGELGTMLDIFSCFPCCYPLCLEV